MSIVELPHHVCGRCGHRWVPRSESIPKVCPKCKSPYWNKARVRKPKVVSEEMESGGELAEIAGKIAEPPAAAKEELKRLGVEFAADSIHSSDTDESDTLPPMTDEMLIGIGAALRDGDIPPIPDVETDSEKLPESDATENFENKFSTHKGADIPKDFWKCTHCDALNEIDNKTGTCSSCGNTRTKLMEGND